MIQTNHMHMWTRVQITNINSVCAITYCHGKKQTGLGCCVRGLAYQFKTNTKAVSPISSEPVPRYRKEFAHQKGWPNATVELMLSYLRPRRSEATQLAVSLLDIIPCCDFYYESLLFKNTLLWFLLWEPIILKNNFFFFLMCVWKVKAITRYSCDSVK